jgi:hypothetical protein
MVRREVLEKVREAHREIKLVFGGEEVVMDNYLRALQLLSESFQFAGKNNFVEIVEKCIDKDDLNLLIGYLRGLAKEVIKEKSISKYLVANAKHLIDLRELCKRHKMEFDQSTEELFLAAKVCADPKFKPTDSDRGFVVTLIDTINRCAVLKNELNSCPRVVGDPIMDLVGSMMEQMVFRRHQINFVYGPKSVFIHQADAHVSVKLWEQLCGEYCCLEARAGMLRLDEPSMESLYQIMDEKGKTEVAKGGGVKLFVSNSKAAMLLKNDKIDAITIPDPLPSNLSLKAVVWWRKQIELSRTQSGPVTEPMPVVMSEPEPVPMSEVMSKEQMTELLAKWAGKVPWDRRDQDNVPTDAKIKELLELARVDPTKWADVARMGMIYAMHGKQFDFLYLVLHSMSELDRHKSFDQLFEFVINSGGGNRDLRDQAIFSLTALYYLLIQSEEDTYIENKIEFDSTLKRIPWIWGHENTSLFRYGDVFDGMLFIMQGHLRGMLPSYFEGIGNGQVMCLPGRQLVELRDEIREEYVRMATVMSSTEPPEVGHMFELGEILAAWGLGKNGDGHKEWKMDGPLTSRQRVEIETDVLNKFGISRIEVAQIEGGNDLLLEIKIVWPRCVAIVRLDDDGWIFRGKPAMDGVDEALDDLMYGIFGEGEKEEVSVSEALTKLKHESVLLELGGVLRVGLVDTQKYLELRESAEREDYTKEKDGLHVPTLEMLSNKLIHGELFVEELKQIDLKDKTHVWLLKCCHRGLINILELVAFVADDQGVGELRISESRMKLIDDKTKDGPMIEWWNSLSVNSEEIMKFIGKANTDNSIGAELISWLRRANMGQVLDLLRSDLLNLGKIKFFRDFWVRPQITVSESRHSRVEVS